MRKEAKRQTESEASPRRPWSGRGSAGSVCGGRGGGMEGPGGDQRPSMAGSRSASPGRAGLPGSPGSPGSPVTSLGTGSGSSIPSPTSPSLASCGKVRAPCLPGGGVLGAEGSHPGRAGNREAKALFVQTDSGLQVSTRGSRQWVGPLGQSQRGRRTPGTPGRGWGGWLLTTPASLTGLQGLDP